MSRKAATELLVGIHSVNAALQRSPEQLQRLMVAEEAHNPRVLELVRLARNQGVQVVSETRVVLDSRSDGQRHQDVMAEFLANNLFSEKSLDEVLDTIEGDPLLLVLDGVQDPHNLGACLRTADAAGVHLVIAPKDKAASLTPVVRRAASGAAEILPIAFVTNLARVLRQLKDRGVWLAGTTDHADQDIYQADLTGPLALVMGSEGRGMRRLTEELCDFRLRIPMRGTVESLNVSVATAVCLYEIARQRSVKQ